jgi:hypothetical protein
MKKVPSRLSTAQRPRAARSGMVEGERPIKARQKRKGSEPPPKEEWQALSVFGAKTSPDARKARKGDGEPVDARSTGPQTIRWAG